MNVNKVIEGTKEYLFQSIDSMAETDFGISLLRPLIKTGINNKFYKIEEALKFVADKDNNIDIDKFVDDAITSILNGKKGNLPVGEIATIQFGDNAVTIVIPFINRYFKFDSKDFIKFKNYLVENYGN